MIVSSLIFVFAVLAAVFAFLTALWKSGPVWPLTALASLGFLTGLVILLTIG